MGYKWLQCVQLTQTAQYRKVYSVELRNYSLVADAKVIPEMLNHNPKCKKNTSKIQKNVMKNGKKHKIATKNFFLIRNKMLLFFFI